MLGNNAHSYSCTAQTPFRSVGMGFASSQISGFSYAVVLKSRSMMGSNSVYSFLHRNYRGDSPPRCFLNCWYYFLRKANLLFGKSSNPSTPLTFFWRKSCITEVATMTPEATSILTDSETNRLHDFVRIERASTETALEALPDSNIESSICQWFDSSFGVTHPDEPFNVPYPHTLSRKAPWLPTNAVTV